jgi:hypothetical protein
MASTPAYLGDRLTAEDATRVVRSAHQAAAVVS